MITFQRTHTHYSFLTIILFVALSINLTFSTKSCHPNDKNALLKIQTHFQTNTWNASTDCCTWDIWYASVKCNANGRVTDIYMQAALEGPIPSAFGDLTYLESLKVWPSLSGTIPKSFTKLVNLKQLDLSQNDLSGPIPEFIGQLKSLTYLNLGNNGEISGKIPSSLSQLKNLKSLLLYNNKLTGPIPASLTKMKSLVELHLGGNPMGGTIPPGFSHLPKLTNLDLTQCELKGSIPESFGYFKNSNFTLSLSANHLTGSIPRSLGRVNFREIRLGMNHLIGDASFLFGSNKTMLRSIYLGPNNLKFDFSKVDLPQGIRDIYLLNNKIYGFLPKRLGQLPLQSIDVSNNQLCGPIPTGRRLKRFSPENFANNKCLCGIPLPPCKS